MQLGPLPFEFGKASRVVFQHAKLYLVCDVQHVAYK